MNEDHKRILLDHSDPELLRSESEVWCEIVTVARELAGASFEAVDLKRFALLAEQTEGALVRCAGTTLSPHEPDVIEARERLEEWLGSLKGIRGIVERLYFAKFSVRWLQRLVRECELLGEDEVDDEEMRSQLKNALQNAAMQVERTLVDMRAVETDGTTKNQESA
jgi:hypothetical protein